MSIESNRVLVLHRYIAENDSEEITTSHYKARFIKGEYYHAAKYYGVSGFEDEWYCIVIGVFEVRGVREEIKPFVLKWDCKKYLTHKP